jgi:hypothetical protein
MLSDIARKVLRILVNYSKTKGRTPTIQEICIKTGRADLGVYQALDELKKERYIEWERSDPEIIKVLQEWEYQDKPQ